MFDLVAQSSDDRDGWFDAIEVRHASRESADSVLYLVYYIPYACAVHAVVAGLTPC